MAKRRSYDSPARREAARATRASIIAAAREILLAGGYDGMTVARLADTAGVSPQTVYNSIGGKAQVVKAVYDVMLAGDDDPTPMSQRPAFLALSTSSDPEAFFRAYAHLSRLIFERVGPLLGVLLQGGSGGDADLRALVTTIEGERRTGNGHALDRLEESHGIPDLPGGRARLHDIVWTLTAPEVADRLIRQCGWSPDDYETWLGDQLAAVVRPAK
ncbi:MAG TPA: helix-turn-helix domain-containing protein [Gordonia sp. (in: high G+C Gram-positive bacteria)]|uniref:TetR/AcrR family transcriptional regulator n=1 Tax=unclassified Gordonia (in: high G+C Gram-positive bacteria) TaxID=2657482 RepID=UPI000FC312CA|nr:MULTISPECIES: TetR/AcrR family transcriptional regulator [unclassified Gordonia (in: high G+C Gram-positive bacteria)]RUP36207.1 MAG: TetR/AcrR family transcriptional regulator [Gordonia sp. (in: high G+C Gram-positive bacteria)]HNP58374.1 helix-turn-helix domain-containing protein [Gordonia sp. (in: high G+C Gram-positive bacteria)]HRC49978.1 helix-turn-helix domain-containing protein [Gordonia sp. (in: high G+C Gram-positive bacteria)]